MMPNVKPPARINPTEPHDPYKMRTLEQILMLFNGGEFMTEIMTGHSDLMHELLDHNADHGPKGCEGTMSIKLNYKVGNAGDVGMSAQVSFSGPKKPPSSAGAFIDDAGHLTLYSPMMKRMHQPLRDATDHDPETGEVRDA
ncbi:hypothetical protein [Loktanella sp. 3ANDIMAR09]|uniref:hypothetical protein n=1 Tax=Loktanella sp. 3ANDIMAR09 TaxID=1225657 RepID=UPI000B1E9B66|nr:hypothetical protein [Loktanella sp. 3ANDIMAR09]